MKTLIKSLAIASFVIGASATAQAQSQKKISATITFDRSAPVPVTYTEINKKAKRACKRAYRGSYLPTRNKAVRRCKEELVSKAISAIQMPSLTAFHDQQTGRSDDPVKLAAKQ